MSTHNINFLYMKLLLINTLWTVSDSFTSECIEDIIEWAKSVYRENYSFMYSDSNYKTWIVNCMDICLQDITNETFKFIK